MANGEYTYCTIRLERAITRAVKRYDARGINPLRVEVFPYSTRNRKRYSQTVDVWTVGDWAIDTKEKLYRISDGGLDDEPDSLIGVLPENLSKQDEELLKKLLWPSNS